MRHLVQTILIFCLVPVFATPSEPVSPLPSPNWKFVENRLKQAHFTAPFIQTLKANYDPSQFREVLELNTLLFLKRSDYHGIQVTPEAATLVRSFVETNHEALGIAEKNFGVTMEVIASLLWLESRHGKNIGTFHVASVFIDLLQADRPANVHYLHQAAKRFTPRVSAKNRKDITARTEKRVKWAIAELKALQKIHKLSPDIIRDLRGSFAGAFGMAQFLPTSYVAYAKSFSPHSTPDLTKTEDAIQSVAYYLHKNGWKKDKPQSYVLSLMRYNNSQDYANAILKLADQIVPEREKSKRTPAARKPRPKKRIVPGP